MPTQTAGIARSDFVLSVEETSSGASLQISNSRRPKAGGYALGHAQWTIVVMLVFFAAWILRAFEITGPTPGSTLFTSHYMHVQTHTHTLSEAVLWPRLAVKTEKHPKMLRATRAVLNLVFSLMYCAVNLPVSSKCTCFQLDLACNRFGVGPPYFIIHQDVMCTWAIGTHVAELKIRTIVRTWAPLTYRASCVAYDFLEPLPAKPRKEYALPWLLHEKEPVNSQHA